MDNEIMVSIICNVFNHGEYLRDALQGFVIQKTDFPFEVLIHDDASTDNSADIIREYEDKYPELIKPIYQTENQYSKGVKFTRKFQLPRAKGKYVAFCEGDDYWINPLKLQKQVDYLEANPDCSLCCTSTIWLDMRTGKQLDKCRTEFDKDISLEEIIEEKKGRIFQFGSILIRKKVYEAIPNWKDAFPVGDTPIAMAAAVAGRVHMLSDVTTVYRNHAKGSWTAQLDSNTQHKIKILNRMICGFEEFNKATEFQYNDIIAKRICMTKYNIAVMSRDCQALKSPELRAVYLSKSVSRRMWDLFKCKFPKLYRRIAALMQH